MKLRVGYEKKDLVIRLAESINDWAWWGLFVAMVIMEVIVILKILEKI